MITDFYTVEDGKAVHYIRSGECNQCGECCGIKYQITYSINTSFGDTSADAEEDFREDDWSSWEGFTLFWAQGLWWYFKVTNVVPRETPSPCPYQDPETKLCKLWNDVDRFPAICRYWPFRESDLDQFPSCGFKFTRVVEEG